MNLRETIAIEIHAEGWNGGEEWDDVHHVKQDNYRQQADAAIATFTEALLDDTVVEAAASALLAETQRRIGFDSKECKALDELVSVVRQDYLIDASAALTAALAAMGAVTKEQGDE